MLLLGLPISNHRPLTYGLLTMGVEKIVTVNKLLELVQESSIKMMETEHLLSQTIMLLRVPQSWR